LAPGAEVPFDVARSACAAVAKAMLALPRSSIVANFFMFETPLRKTAYGGISLSFIYTLPSQ
jgi:hypothetical protein